MTIYEIKARTVNTSPYYFTAKTMKFFGQTLRSFKVSKLPDGRFQISAPMKDRNTGKIMGYSQRYFNPVNNELEVNWWRVELPETLQSVLTKHIKTKTKITDANSSVNQKIKGEFVSREVYCNVNSLVEYCLSKGYEDRESPVSLDSIENFYEYPEYYGTYAKFAGGSEAQRDAEIERLRDIQDKYDSDIASSNDKIYDIIRDEIAEIENLETEPQEIFEWWAVSSYLYEKLKEHGCPVVDAGSCNV